MMRAVFISRVFRRSTLLIKAGWIAVFPLFGQPMIQFFHAPFLRATIGSSLHTDPEISGSDIAAKVKLTPQFVKTCLGESGHESDLRIPALLRRMGMNVILCRQVDDLSAGLFNIAQGSKTALDCMIMPPLSFLSRVCI